jgi:predicted HTH domain antitoxin
MTREVNVSSLKIDVPDEALVALKLEPEALAEELRLAAAVKMYELGRLSSGAAAQLAGVPRTVFLSKLADYGVDTFDMTREELEEDVSRA